jgi:outer membrane protein assembly factor BamD (BamD/ComL family)
LSRERLAAADHIAQDVVRATPKQIPAERPDGLPRGRGRVMRIAFGLLVVLLAAGALRAEDADRPARFLASADQLLATGQAGLAIRTYLHFSNAFPDHERADYAVYKTGESSQLALAQLGGIIPAAVLTEANPERAQYEALAHNLAKTYGFYAAVSEGDSYWYYDMRAYRELIERFPESEYADDARFYLVEPGPRRRTWVMGVSEVADKAARTVIQRYEAVLRDYPQTNRRAEIEQAIAELRRFLR